MHAYGRSSPEVEVRFRASLEVDGQQWVRGAHDLLLIDDVYDGFDHGQVLHARHLEACGTVRYPTPIPLSEQSSAPRRLDGWRSKRQYRKRRPTTQSFLPCNPLHASDGERWHL